MGRESPYFPSTRFALALILCALAGLRLPAFTCCVALAFAFAAWLASGIGYFRAPGRPKSFVGRLFLRLVVNNPISVPSD